MANWECQDVFYMNIYLHNQYAIFSCINCPYRFQVETDFHAYFFCVGITSFNWYKCLKSFMSLYTTKLIFLLNIQATM